MSLTLCEKNEKAPDSLSKTIEKNGFLCYTRSVTGKMAGASREGLKRHLLS